MRNTKISREVTPRDINCLENLVVAYNTVFLMSSIFVVLIASTIKEIFIDFDRLLSPSLLLLIVGGFIVLLASLGYIGVGRKSSSLVSLYTMLLIFIFVMEISAGFGILSFRKQIRLAVSSKMKGAMNEYFHDPMTANLIDYVQLEFECCGVNSFRDWDEIFEGRNGTGCSIGDFNVPASCCSKLNDMLPQTVNRNGCLPALSFLLHKSALSLTSALVAICTIQILGAYFSYTLASSLSKFKIQEARRNQSQPPRYAEAVIPVTTQEKSNYF